MIQWSYEMNENKDYYAAQFDRLGPSTEYGFDLKISSGSGSTNWMRITEKQLEVIKKVLQEG